jgi:hypothetical protein
VDVIFGTILLIGLLALVLKIKKENTPQSATQLTPKGAREFVTMLSVTVDHPNKLAEEINRVKSKHSTGNTFVGEPQIAPDGLTANIPLFRQLL